MSQEATSEPQNHSIEEQFRNPELWGKDPFNTVLVPYLSEAKASHQLLALQDTSGGGFASHHMSTVADMEQALISPGEAAKVMIKWRSNWQGIADSSFREGLDMQSNTHNLAKNTAKLYSDWIAVLSDQTL